MEQTIVAEAVRLLSGPGGLVSFVHRGMAGTRLGGPSILLDIGYSTSLPGWDPACGPVAGSALPLAGRL